MPDAPCGFKTKEPIQIGRFKKPKELTLWRACTQLNGDFSRTRPPALEVFGNRRILVDVVHGKGGDRRHAEVLKLLVKRQERPLQAPSVIELVGLKERLGRGVSGGREHVVLVGQKAARAVLLAGVFARAAVRAAHRGISRHEVDPALHLPGRVHGPDRRLHDDEVGSKDLGGLVLHISIVTHVRFQNAPARLLKPFAGNPCHFGVERALAPKRRSEACVDDEDGGHGENPPKKLKHGGSLPQDNDAPRSHAPSEGKFPLMA